MNDFSTLPLQQLISIWKPSLIRIYPSDSAGFWTWEFSYPSDLLVTAELSASQSSTMADAVANISGDLKMPPSTSGLLELLSRGTESDDRAGTLR